MSKICILSILAMLNDILSYEICEVSNWYKCRKNYKGFFSHENFTDLGLCCYTPDAGYKAIEGIYVRDISQVLGKRNGKSIFRMDNNFPELKYSITPYDVDCYKHEGENGDFLCVTPTGSLIENIKNERGVPEIRCFDNEGKRFCRTLEVLHIQKLGKVVIKKDYFSSYKYKTKIKNIESSENCNEFVCKFNNEDLIEIKNVTGLIKLKKNIPKTKEIHDWIQLSKVLVFSLMIMYISSKLNKPVYIDLLKCNKCSKCVIRGIRHICTANHSEIKENYISSVKKRSITPVTLIIIILLVGLVSSDDICDKLCFLESQTGDNNASFILKMINGDIRYTYTYINPDYDYVINSFEWESQADWLCEKYNRVREWTYDYEKTEVGCKGKMNFANPGNIVFSIKSSENKIEVEGTACYYMDAYKRMICTNTTNYEDDDLKCSIDEDVFNINNVKMKLKERMDEFLNKKAHFQLRHNNIYLEYGEYSYCKFVRDKQPLVFDPSYNPIPSSKLCSRGDYDFRKENPEDIFFQWNNGIIMKKSIKINPEIKCIYKSKVSECRYSLKNMSDITYLLPQCTGLFDLVYKGVNMKLPCDIGEIPLIFNDNVKMCDHTIETKKLNKTFVCNCTGRNVLIIDEDYFYTEETVDRLNLNISIKIIVSIISTMYLIFNWLLMSCNNNSNKCIPRVELNLSNIISDNSDERIYNEEEISYYQETERRSRKYNKSTPKEKIKKLILSKLNISPKKRIINIKSFENNPIPVRTENQIDDFDSSDEENVYENVNLLNANEDINANGRIYKTTTSVII